MFQRLLAILLVTGLAYAWSLPAGAQSPEDAAKAAEARERARSAGSAKPGEGEAPAAQPDAKGKDGQPADGSADKADSSKVDKPKVVTRPAADAAQTADISKLREQVGRDGLIRFNLQGVPWPDLLQWLAEVSQLSLDWQELPGDTLNLRTQQPYSVEEARDLINRHLLSRGYTMLKHGELLSVLPIATINPGLVPRVRPDELDTRHPHEFVKVSFPLDWLVADKAVEELKPMLSPNGKLSPLASTNRIEAMDAVVNLLEIRTILTEEQTTTGDKRVVDVFTLRHARAGEAVLLLEQILGLETHRNVSGGVDDNSGRQILQQLQQLQQNMQRGNNSGSSKASGGEEEKPKLIVNERDNSIVAHAPPDKMEIIRQTVLAIDTPAANRGSTQHTKIFRLSTLDPVPLVAIIQELGDFSPATKIQADSTNNSLIVQGSLSDLNSIWELVQQLDGSTRNFEVIPLRRLAADEVAGTIQYLMGSEEEDKSNDNSGYYSYFSYRSGRGGSSQTKEEKRPFKVDADIENNRLLLWANEVELEEVQNLLVKMGEIPAGQGSDQTLRVLDLSSDEEADAVLERLRQMWPHLAPNELQIQPSPRRQPTPSDDVAPPEDDQPAVEAAPAEAPSPAATGDLRTTAVSTVAPAAPHPLRVIDAELQPHRATDHRPDAGDVNVPALPRPRQPADVLIAQAPGSRTAAAVPGAPPVIIQRGPDGKLIITSPDTRALDQLEEMVADVAPPRKDYHIFHLKHPQTWAYGIELTLKDFFKEDMDGKPVLDWWGGVVNQKDNSPSRLSKRRPLKIISDADSRTILVQGATPAQLQTISDLIDIYDQPTSSDPQALRTTKFFSLKYSGAQTIADTLKAVYRDLLSTNDPALKDPGNDKESKPQNSGTTLTYVYNRGGTDEESQGEEPSRITFQGLLSVGVDEISNTLVVSSIEGLMPEITELVETLDEAARPANNFKVVPLDSSINPALIQARLQKLLASQRGKATPDGDQAKNGPPNGEGNPNGGGNRPSNGPGRRN